MANTVWKYEVPVTDVHSVKMPVGAKVLHIAALGPTLLNLWAEVDPDAPVETVVLYVVGTGRPIPVTYETLRHVGSVVAAPFVWHVYRQGEVPW